MVVSVSVMVLVLSLASRHTGDRSAATSVTRNTGLTESASAKGPTEDVIAAESAGQREVMSVPASAGRATEQDALPPPELSTEDSGMSFEDRYRETSAEELVGISIRLNAELTRAVEGVADQMFESLQYQSQFVPLDNAPSAITSADVRSGHEPVGMGRVWPVVRAVPGGGGVSMDTVYITEQEHPEIFRQLDERIWTARQGKKRMLGD